MLSFAKLLRNGSPVLKNFQRTADKKAKQLKPKHIEQPNKSVMRREVLRAFKKLHRARLAVFEGDQLALTEGRKQINEHFRKNKTVEDEQEIKKMVQLAQDVEKELRTNVIQAVQKSDGVYELRITEETTKLDNISFDPYGIQKPKDGKDQLVQFGNCGGVQARCHSSTDRN